MNSNGQYFKYFGIFCGLSAVALYGSTIKFWFDRNNLYSGMGSWMMIVVGALTAFCFSLLAAAMFIPKRFKRFWEWWYHEG